jgi:hypothetical protein
MLKHEALSVIGDIFLEDVVTQEEIYEYLNTLKVYQRPSEITRVNDLFDFKLVNTGAKTLKEKGCACVEDFWRPKYDHTGHLVADEKIRNQIRIDLVERAIKMGHMFYISSNLKYGVVMLAEKMRNPDHSYSFASNNREGVLNFIGINAILQNASELTYEQTFRDIRFILAHTEKYIKDIDFEQLAESAKNSAEKIEFLAAIQSMREDIAIL